MPEEANRRANYPRLVSLSQASPSIATTFAFQDYADEPHGSALVVDHPPESSGFLAKQMSQ